MDLAKLRKLTAEQLRNIDPQEVFQSPEFAQHLQRLTEEIMKIGGAPKQNWRCMSSPSPTVLADGQMERISTSTPSIPFLATTPAL